MEKKILMDNFEVQNILLFINKLFTLFKSDFFFFQVKNLDLTLIYPYTNNYITKETYEITLRIEH